MTTPSEITALLSAWRQGSADARDRLIPLVYDELRVVARQRLRHERPDHTLQVTALVNEAYLRLVDQAGAGFEDRAHFFGAAARLMRQILVDHARARRAAKRGGGATRVALGDVEVAADADGLLPELDEALTRLAALDAEQARLVELRFFGGLTLTEAGVVMGRSPATLKRRWSTARAWLQRELSGAAVA